MSVLLVYIQTICFDFNNKKREIFILISFTFLLLFCSSFVLFYSSLFYFVIWYQSHFEPILVSICWAYQATRYRVAIGPSIIYSPAHELAVSA